ncbi:hypothetical protein [Bacillus salipaludis]|uniref:hypothetical protein n=1 Tax=Bacillus salipaludis TaxID=2547811 RepID=UPI002E1E9EEA|nr:hypothetical protein [Bacillus salipaludis]
MLVNFMDLKEEVIFFRKDYSDITPILSMVDTRCNVSIFLDPNGVERVIGRFHNYEFTIEISNSTVKESLLVSMATDENTVKKYWDKRK